MIDITEADFAAWKHHPVTKFWMQYLFARRDELGSVLVNFIYSSVRSPDSFTLGEMKGQLLAYVEMADTTYESIVKFNEPQQETREDHAA